MRLTSLNRPRAAAWLLAGLAAALAGCNRDAIQAYRVAKEPSSPQSQAAAPTAAPAARPALEWTLPSGWQEVPPGEMRLASFRVSGAGGKQADVSVIPLPGLAGKDLDNVNRWRGQVGLPPVTDEELPKLAQAVSIGGLPAQLYDQSGQNPGSGDKSRILAALLRREGVAWFFKMTGDDDWVAQQKTAFVSFLESVKFTEAAPVAAAPALSGELPASHPPIGGGAGMGTGMAVAAAPSGDRPDWQVPPGWKEVPGGQFLVAKFVISAGDSAQASVNVSMSAGEGGGLAGNVNRWRGQLGLGPAADADIAQGTTTLDLDGAQAKVVDLAGTDPRSNQKTRLVGAIVPMEGRTWFFKLMGNEGLVESEKAAFDSFLKSVRFSNGNPK